LIFEKRMFHFSHIFWYTFNMKYRHFSFPPIIESLVDIQIAPNEKITFEALESLFDKIKSDFPQKNILNQHQIKFGPIGKQLKTETTEQKNGFVAKSKNESRAIQYRINGFTFSFLNFYEKWEVLRAESQALWDLYNATFNPSISRIATKYVNKIVIPETVFNLDDYFVNLPKVNSQTLGILENFMFRYSLDRSGLKANVGLSAIPKTSEKPETAFVFDIDVFKLSTESGDRMWNNLDLLNKYADDIFFESLTEKAGEIFK